MNICEETSYKHLEDLIQRNLSSEDKVIDEVNLSIDLYNQLEHSLVPFIRKIYSKNTVTTLNHVTAPHFCDIDYDNSENEITEIIEDNCIKRNTLATSEDFNNSKSLSDDNCLNRNKDSLNNNKLHRSFSKWNHRKSFSSSMSQKALSTFKRARHLSGKPEPLVFPSEESDKYKSDSCVFQNAREGNVLKENNHFDVSQLSRKVKQQFGCDNKRVSLSAVRRNKNNSNKRTLRENALVHASVESITQEICRSDDSDSDEELLKVPVALLHSSESPGKSSELTKEKKCLKSCPISCLSLDKIIEIRKSETQKSLALKSQELEFENNSEVYRDNELLQLMEQVDCVGGSKLEQDRIVDLPPGLEIFNFQVCHYFCPMHGLSLKSCGLSEDKGTLVEKKLSKMSLMEVQDMISLGVMKTHLNSALFKEPLLKYLFKILSAHNNEKLAYACQDTFFWYIDSSTVYWYPSMTDMIATILNYGIDVTNNCPVKDILLEVEKTLELTEHPSCFGKEKHEFSLVINGLSRIIEVFTLFLEQQCLQNCYQEEVCDFILLLCWLSLDVRLLGKCTEIKIGRCIAAGLEIISASDWPDKMKYLAEKLAELGEHHHNTLYIALRLPVSGRGCHLQRAVSFLAVQYLLRAESPCFFADVTPFMLLELLRVKPLHHINDYFLLHSIISLVDLCVGNKVSSLYRDAISRMCNIALTTYSKIGKTFQHPEGNKVKALLLRVYSKWSFLILSMPRKMEMFTSFGHTECDARLESDYIPEVEEETG